ncbi:MAG: hypothetical protein V1918_09425 [Planctomycetota bacterium]
MKRIALGSLLCFAFCVGELHAATLAKITSFRGDVKIAAGGGEAKAVTMINYPLKANDKIVTGQGMARVLYPDGSWFDVRQNSDLTILEGALDIRRGDVTADIMQGSLALRRFHTPSGVVAVKGTNLTLSVDASGRLDISCDAGFVGVTNLEAGLEILLPSGRQVQVLMTPDGGVEIVAVKGDVTVTLGTVELKLSQGSAAQVRKTEGGGNAISATNGSVVVTSKTTGQSVNLAPSSGPAQVGPGGQILGAAPGAAVPPVTGPAKGPVPGEKPAEGPKAGAIGEPSIDLILDALLNEINNAANAGGTDSTVGNTNTGSIQGISEP